MQESVHDTSETDQYDIPKLQLPALKLQLRATVIKIKKNMQELVHDTFETDFSNIPKLQLPAIKTVAASYGDKNLKEYVGIT